MATVMALGRNPIRGCGPLIGTNFTNTIQDIKGCIDLQAFYESELGIIFKGYSGWVMGGICPFHADHRPGSFKVNLDNGAYKCFSCGAKGGDVIAFIQAFYELSFKEALEKLKNEWGCYE